MIREAICEGADVMEALEKAKAELGVSDDGEYEFEVLQHGEKKKFGLFGGRPAKVRAFIKIEESFEDKTERFIRDVLDNMGLPDIAITRGADEDNALVSKAIKLQTILKQHPGHTPVCLELRYSNGTVVTISLPERISVTSDLLETLEPLLSANTFMHLG